MIQKHSSQEICYEDVWLHTIESQMKREIFLMGQIIFINIIYLLFI